MPNIFAPQDLTNYARKDVSNTFTSDGSEPPITIEYTGSGEKALDINGGRVDIAGGTNSIDAEGAVHIFGFGDYDDINSEYLCLCWNEADSVYYIRTEKEGDGVLRNISINTTTFDTEGNITANSFVGDGSQLTGIPPPDFTPYAPLAGATFTGSVVAASVSAVSGLNGDYISAANGIFNRGPVYGRNKADTDWLAVIQRNTDGAEAAFDMPYVGALTATGAAMFASAISVNGTTIRTTDGVLEFRDGNDSPADISVGGATFGGRVATGLVLAGTISGGTYVTDASLGNEFRLTLGANLSLSAPNNPVDGQGIAWWFYQGASAYTLTFATGGGGFLVCTADAADVTAFASDPAGTLLIATGEYVLALDRWQTTAVKRYI